MKTTAHGEGCFSRAQGLCLFRGRFKARGIQQSCRCSEKIKFMGWNCSDKLHVKAWNTVCVFSQLFDLNSWSLSHHLVCACGSFFSPRKRFSAFAFPIPPSLYLAGGGKRVLFPWNGSMTEECQLVDTLCAEVSGGAELLVVVLLVHIHWTLTTRTPVYFCAPKKWAEFALRLLVGVCLFVCLGFFCCFVCFCTAALGRDPFWVLDAFPLVFFMCCWKE